MKRGGSFRLHDYDSMMFVGPVETKAQAERRKTSRTRGKRDTMSNWYRSRVHPVQVKDDGYTLTEKYRNSVNEWRKVCVHCLIKYGRVRKNGKVYCNTCARKLFPEVKS